VILKEVKVVCFDTLLQVLILKEMEREDLRDVEEVPQVYRRFAGDTPPPAFWEKRLQAIENKRSRSKKREARDCPSKLRVNKRRQALETLRVKARAQEWSSEVCSRWRLLKREN